MNYIETCTKIAFFLWRSSNYRPLKSVLHVRPGWIIYQNMRETWEKKVMKFEREIPIGLDARRKKTTGGGWISPPPNGIRVKAICFFKICTFCIESPVWGRVEFLWIAPRILMRQSYVINASLYSCWLRFTKQEQTRLPGEAKQWKIFGTYIGTS